MQLLPEYDTLWQEPIPYIIKADEKITNRGEHKMYEQEICERITAAEQSLKSAHHRIDEVVENNKSISEILVEMRYMRRDLNKLIERVNAVEERPARRYDVIINAALSAAIAVVVSMIF